MENRNDDILVNNQVDAVKGELTFDDKVIQKIVGIALEHVEGLLTIDGGFFSNIAGKVVNSNDVTTGIGVEVGKKQVAVDLDIVAEYGKNIKDLYQEVKQLITEEVNRMTQLEVIEVNVNVVDVKTRVQHQKDSVTLQDRVGSAAETTGDFTSKQTEKVKNVWNKTSSNAKKQMEPRVE